MTSFLSAVTGNPFSTPVGSKIEQATDGSLASENWALNMEICDLINETEDGPKDAIKAIRKRLQQAVGKNYTIVMFTLTVLETCVKNCGKRFHVLVCNKEFVNELVRLIGPKNGPPQAVQEKVLYLIQSWVDAFHRHPDLRGVVEVYTELKAKGVEFPMTDLDSMAPIHTPKKSVPAKAEVDPAVLSRSPGNGEPTLSLPTIPSLTPEQLTKLRSDLDILQTNMAVFGEMLNEMTPGNEHPSDIQLFNMHKESDFDEMAKWLGEGSMPSLGGPEPESLTSSEFERFLAERAAAAEALPASASPGGNQSQSRKTKKDPHDSSLYAL
ncbi:unnamed protein product [Nesidiocoris tenuis]|uniref:VHS domain-containing protein n=1 Tax=Nesidiocoris tenuis TaxID=355587 RepID=A0A6H5FZF6_9HEMI|nr:unnamed protein product [Nesidiocoris tenuis]